jgi:hypothetical protein
MTQQASATSLTEQLDQIGDEQLIYRDHEENDNDFGWRLIHVLDMQVEEIWEVQDQIRALIKTETSNPQEKSND